MMDIQWGREIEVHEQAVEPCSLSKHSSSDSTQLYGCSVSELFCGFLTMAKYE